MTSVRLKNVKKIYDKDVVAVHEFSIDIEDKEFIVLVGPSGCGKSTTLRMIAGLEEISSGEIFIGNRLVNDVPPKDRNTAMVFQNYALYPHMTVYENMAFSLKLRKMNKREITNRVHAAASILDITRLLGRKPKALSGGERQRVAIGRAIVRNPYVFLMDEPLSNLDAKLRNQMRAELIKLRQTVDTTFVYVTHDQTEAMTLGDRMVIMKDGYIQQIGTPYKVFHEPANLFVASFVGTPQINLFPSELVLNNGVYQVLFQGTTITLPQERQKLLQQNDQQVGAVILGVRPDQMCLAGSESANDPILAKIDIIETLGSEIDLHLGIGDQNAIVRVSATALYGNDAAFRPYGDDTVSLSFSGECMHLFDPETELSLFKN